jgi:hypothetical protein
MRILTESPIATLRANEFQYKTLTLTKNQSYIMLISVLLSSILYITHKIINWLKCYVCLYIKVLFQKIYGKTWKNYVLIIYTRSCKTFMCWSMVCVNTSSASPMSPRQKLWYCGLGVFTRDQIVVETWICKQNQSQIIFLQLGPGAKS